MAYAPVYAPALEPYDSPRNNSIHGAVPESTPTAFNLTGDASQQAAAAVADAMVQRCIHCT
jgi:hypothetical protein